MKKTKQRRLAISIAEVERKVATIARAAKKRDTVAR